MPTIRGAWTQPVLDGVAGAVSAGAAVAVGELVTSFDGSGTSLVSAVGDQLVDGLAGPLKDVAIALFGTNDKAALVVGIVLVSLLVGAWVGRASRRRSWIAPLGFGAFAVLGAWSYGQVALASAGLGVVAALMAALAGLASLSVLRRLAPAGGPTPAAAMPGPAAGGTRRAFFGAAASVGVGAVVTAAAARRLTAADPAAELRASTTLPRPADIVAVPGAQPFEVPGLSPYITPTPDFYRIDTALVTPRVDPARWRLSFDGLVERSFELTFDELLELDSVEVPVTLSCVSNEVGGDLVGTAVWQGVPLTDLLGRARPTAAATQVVGRSVDGFTAGFPLELLGEDRTALVAYAMNGELLPARHGFPARLVVAGLYGYVSATKWLSQVELTRLEDFDGYWIPRGWSKDGPIKTTSRIDVPRSGEEVPAGRVAVAGVAWAPTRGIQGVEVRVDDGSWQPCTLGTASSDETWVQWHLVWDATPGEHRLTVRAVDGDGEPQDPEPSPPAPDGATGLHSRVVTVRS